MFALAEHVREKYCGGNHSSTSGVCTCLACMIDKGRYIHILPKSVLMLYSVWTCVCLGGGRPGGLVVRTSVLGH